MTRSTLVATLLVVAACGSSDGGGDELPALTATVVEVIGGEDQVDTVGQQLPLPIRILVLDTTGTAAGSAGFSPADGVPVPVPGQLVNFVVTSGGGSVFAGAALTDTIGRAQELWTLGPTAGEQCIEARAVDQETGEPLTFAQICATGLPGPASKAGFTVRHRWVVGDSTITLPAFATDAFNNVVPVPRPIALDSLVADSAGAGWTVTAALPGLHRFQMGDSVFALRVLPPGGTYSATVTIGDTTWTTAGPIAVSERRATSDIGINCAPAGADSSQTYSRPIDTTVRVFRQLGEVIDTLAPPQNNAPVTCLGILTTPNAGNGILRLFSIWATDEGMNNYLTVNAAFVGRVGQSWQYTVTGQTFGGAATGTITFNP